MNFSLRLRPIFLFLVFAALLPARLSSQEAEDTGPAPLPEGTLWYNGDWRPTWTGGFVFNYEWSDANSTEMIFEDFIVADDAGWTVTQLWSNNYIKYLGYLEPPYPISFAHWQIRKDMTGGWQDEGGGGELVASGISPATVSLNRTVCTVPANPCDPGFATTVLTVSVKNISVPLQPGRYWVGVAPVGATNMISIIVDTSDPAANAVGISGARDNAIRWRRNGSGPYSSNFGSPVCCGHNEVGFANVSIGVAGRIGAGPVDSDGDGLRDDVDACPNQNPMGRDADGDGCTDSAAGLGNLVKTLPMAAEMRAPLTAKVLAAQAAQQRGQRNAAINELSALLNQIRAQRGKKIPIATADLLDAYIRNVILSS